MSFANSDGQEIFYSKHGNGDKTIIFLSGLAATSSVWLFQVPFFAENYNVITMDNRGSGQSAMPDEPYTMNIFADDLAAVMDAEEIHKAIIVGASMGGMIAQQFFHKYPEKVEALILSCSGVGPGDDAFVLSDPEALDIISRDIPKSLDEVTELIKELLRCYFHPSYQEKNPEIIEKALALYIENSQPEFAHKQQLAACFETSNFSKQLIGICVPTLILHGDGDKVWPLPNAQLFADKIPNSRLEVFENAGTLIYIEQPEKFNKLVAEFIEGL